jgi:glycosyltransferase involved in cell wall biosynthesis
VEENRKKIKIAYIFNRHFFLGGGEISFYELIKKINNEVFEPVSILTGKGDLSDKLKSQGLRAHITKFPPLKHLLFNHREFIKLIGILKIEQVSLIHVNGSRACFYASLAGRILGIPVIWHVRETIKDYFYYDGLLALLANQIICVSNGVKSKRFKRFGALIGRKITVIYNGVDTVKFSIKTSKKKDIRKKLGIDPKVALLGIIGNIIPLKGHDFLLKGFLKAILMNPDLPLQLLIIGRKTDSEFYQKIKNYISKNNLNKNVIIAAYSPNVSEIFAAIDILALPSQREGFSRTLIEGMSAGLPVVGTNLDEIQEAVSDKNKDFLVEYDDTEMLAALIVKLVQNKQYRVDIGMQNRNRIIDFFQISKHARLIEKVYNEQLR